MRRTLASIAFIIPFIIALSSAASAQTDDRSPASTGGTAQSANRKSADENFELNVAERRITETGFAASTSVEAGEETAHGLLLRVGVGLSADEIDVLLRNVRGQIRFRASLDRVLERLNMRRAASPAP